MALWANIIDLSDIFKLNGWYFTQDLFISMFAATPSSEIHFMILIIHATTKRI